MSGLAVTSEVLNMKLSFKSEVNEQNFIEIMEWVSFLSEHKSEFKINSLLHKEVVAELMASVLCKKYVCINFTIPAVIVRFNFLSLRRGN